MPMIQVNVTAEKSIMVIASKEIVPQYPAISSMFTCSWEYCLELVVPCSFSLELPLLGQMLFQIVATLLPLLLQMPRQVADIINYMVVDNR